MRKREHSTVENTPDEEEFDPQFVTALARGLGVLRAFRRDETSLGNQEIARRTGLPKPTVSRLTYTLVKLGYLAYLPDMARYQLSAGVLALGYTCLGSFGIRQIAHPLMQQMADETGIQVAIGTRDGLTMVYLDVCKGDSPFSLALEAGSHIRLATSAMGRAYLAATNDADCDRLMRQLKDHDPDGWPAMRQGVERARLEFPRLGYVTSAKEWKPEVNSVGVPIRIDGDRVEFALNCGGPVFLVAEDRLHSELGPRLRRLAKEIEERLDQARI